MGSYKTETSGSAVYKQTGPSIFTPSFSQSTSAYFKPADSSSANYIGGYNVLPSSSGATTSSMYKGDIDGGGGQRFLRSSVPYQEQQQQQLPSAYMIHHPQSASYSHQQQQQQHYEPYHHYRHHHHNKQQQQEQQQQHHRSFHYQDQQHIQADRYFIDSAFPKTASVWAPSTQHNCNQWERPRKRKRRLLPPEEAMINDSNKLNAAKIIRTGPDEDNRSTSADGDSPVYTTANCEDKGSSRIYGKVEEQVVTPDDPYVNAMLNTHSQSEFALFGNTPELASDDTWSTAADYTSNLTVPTSAGIPTPDPISFHHPASTHHHHHHRRNKDEGDDDNEDDAPVTATGPLQYPVPILADTLLSSPDIFEHLPSLSKTNEDTSQILSDLTGQGFLDCDLTAAMKEEDPFMVLALPTDNEQARQQRQFGLDTEPQTDTNKWVATVGIENPQHFISPPSDKVDLADQVQVTFDSGLTEFEQQALNTRLALEDGGNPSPPSANGASGDNDPKDDRQTRLITRSRRTKYSSDDLVPEGGDPSAGRPELSEAVLEQLNRIDEFTNNENYTKHLVEYKEGISFPLGEGGRELLRACLNVRGCKGRQLQGASVPCLLRLAKTWQLWNVALRIKVERSSGRLCPAHDAFVRFKATQSQMRKFVKKEYMVTERDQTGKIAKIVYDENRKITLGKEGREALRAQLRRLHDKHASKMDELLEANGFRYSELRNATVQQLSRMAFVCNLWDQVVTACRHQEEKRDGRGRPRSTRRKNASVADTIDTTSAEFVSMFQTAAAHNGVSPPSSMLFSTDRDSNENGLDYLETADKEQHNQHHMFDGIGADAFAHLFASGGNNNDEVEAAYCEVGNVDSLYNDAPPITIPSPEDNAFYVDSIL